MAVSIVGTPSTGFVDNAGTGNQYSVPVPSGLLVGELWVICTWVDTNGAVTDITAPGFTGAAAAQVTATSGYPAQRVLYKVAGAAESAVTVTVSGSTGLFYCKYASFRVQGYKASSPIDVTATGTIAVGSATTVAVPSASVTDNGSLAIVLVSRADGGATVNYQPPGTMTELFESSATWAYGGVAYEAVNSGTYNPGNYSIPYTGGPGDGVIITVVIRPALIKYVQANSNSTGNTGNTTITLSITPTVGNFLAGIVTWGTVNASDLSSITDNGTGGTWVINTRILTDSTNQQSGAIVFGYGWSVAPTTITVNYAGSVSWRGILLMEFSGQKSGNPLSLEQGRLQTGVTTNTSSGTGSQTPPQDRCLVVGVSQPTDTATNGSSIFTAGTNFTEANEWTTPSSTNSLVGEYWIQTTATAVNADFTVNTGTRFTTWQAIFLPDENTYTNAWPPANPTQRITRGHTPLRFQ